MTEPVKLCMDCRYNVENGRWCKMYELRKREAREQCEGTYWERDPSIPPQFIGHGSSA